MLIYGDNQVEAEWFKQLNGRFSAVPTAMLGPRGTNPAVIDDLLAYDRPDIILTVDGAPLLVLEKTREVPTGHNIGQRFARLVRAAERGIPTVKFLPFDARKHGLYSGMCYMNIRLLAALRRMSEIHRTPAMAINWPIDVHGELIVDGTEDRALSLLVDGLLRAEGSTWWPEARATIAYMEREYDRRLVRRAAYADPPGSVEVVTTIDLLRRMRAAGLDPGPLDVLRNVERTLVYTMRMTPDKCRRQDPYTGMQFVYDYISCRSGPAVDQKRVNLILSFPLVTKRRFMDANPNDPTTKSCNWYLTANALIFSDGSHLLRVSRL